MPAVMFTQTALVLGLRERLMRHASVRFKEALHTFPTCCKLLLKGLDLSRCHVGS